MAVRKEPSPQPRSISTGAEREKILSNSSALVRDFGKYSTTASFVFSFARPRILSVEDRPPACPPVIDRRYRILNRLEVCLPDRPEARLPLFLRIDHNRSPLRFDFQIV